MKIVSWNVNGIRACVKKGFLNFFKETDAEIVCLQETKLQEGQIELELHGYHQFWNYARKKGYSGTAIFSKIKPLSVQFGLGSEDEDEEGRVLTAEYEDFFLVNAYSPNSQRDLARLGFRLNWEDRLLILLNELKQFKPVILCGDLNVAHREVDLKNPRSNRGNSGFTDEERNKMTRILESGFIDSYRFFYPEVQGAYTWWSYMSQVRERNIGWRIDYFIVSENLAPLLKNAHIHSSILGSDHCPIMLELEINKL